MSTVQQISKVCPKDEKIMREEGRRLALCEEGEEVVITGMSGTFPESENVRVLEENLLAKKDLITEDYRRWKTCMFQLH